MCALYLFYACSTGLGQVCLRNMLNEVQFVSFVGITVFLRRCQYLSETTTGLLCVDTPEKTTMKHSQSIFLVMRSNHHITLSRISNDMNFFDNVKTFLFSLGNTMWLDPLVERTYLETINVTTNNLNIRMELLEEKLAADNKQVLMS